MNKRFFHGDSQEKKLVRTRLIAWRFVATCYAIVLFGYLVGLGAPAGPERDASFELVAAIMAFPLSFFALVFAWLLDYGLGGLIFDVLNGSGATGRVVIVTFLFCLVSMIQISYIEWRVKK